MIRICPDLPKPVQEDKWETQSQGSTQDGGASEAGSASSSGTWSGWSGWTGFGKQKKDSQTGGGYGPSNKRW